VILSASLTQSAVSELLKMTLNALYCSKCKDTFDTKRTWLSHLLEVKHQSKDQKEFHSSSSSSPSKTLTNFQNFLGQEIQILKQEHKAALQFLDDLQTFKLNCLQLFSNSSSTKDDAELQTALQTDSQIRSFQASLRKDFKHNHLIVKKAQDLLLSSLTARTDYEFSGMYRGLIIGVDARAGTYAGYCLNLIDKTLCFYVIKREDLPWILHNADDSAEFEMRNLMFALTIWKPQILKLKQLSIFTDNFAMVWKPQKKYGTIAKHYINHFVNCEGVKIFNYARMAVNKHENLKTFAKYIQPADDLSRWHIKTALNFLSRFYEIKKENVHGTHIQKERPGVFNLRPWYDRTPYYSQILDLVNANTLFDHFQSKFNIFQNNLRLIIEPSILFCRRIKLLETSHVENAPAILQHL